MSSRAFTRDRAGERTWHECRVARARLRRLSGRLGLRFRDSRSRAGQRRADGSVTQLDRCDAAPVERKQKKNKQTTRKEQ